MTEYLNYSEAARYLDMTRQAVRQKAINGQIAYVPGKGIPLREVLREREEIVNNLRGKLERMGAW